MSPGVRKPTICICENKDADQLRGYREADQRLCFRYLDSTIPLLPKSKLICVFVFAYANRWFSHAGAQLEYCCLNNHQFSQESSRERLRTHETFR